VSQITRSRFGSGIRGKTSSIVSTVSSLSAAERRGAAPSAAAASKYSAGAIATEEFVSELLRELRASRRRSTQRTFIALVPFPWTPSLARMLARRSPWTRLAGHRRGGRAVR